mgnify:CR=1 FL=1
MLLAPMAIQMGMSFLGGQSKRHAAKIQAAHAAIAEKKAFVNQAAQTAYSAEWAKQSTDYYNKETTDIYDKQLKQYEQQLVLNNKAGNVAFGAEMSRMEEQYNKFAFKQNDMQKELMRAQGVSRASGGRGSGYSRSRRRADMINQLGEFGRANRMLERNLMSAERASKARLAGLELKHQQADTNALAKVQIQPRLRFTSTGGGPNLQAPQGAMPVPGYGFGDFASDFGAAMFSVGGLKGTAWGNMD